VELKVEHDGHGITSWEKDTNHSKGEKEERDLTLWEKITGGWKKKSEENAGGKRMVKAG